MTLRTINILAGLANENRLRLFLALLEKDFCVCELQALFGLEQSCLSHQLRLLRFYGLVKSEKEGRWVTYSIPEEVRNNPVIQAIKQSTQLPPWLREKIFQVNIRPTRANDSAPPERRIDK